MSKYTTIGAIKSGKMQYNVKDARDFRATMAKWHNADFELAEEILRKSDRVKALRTLISSNNDLIEKLNKGESIIGNKTLDELKSEIATWESQIVDENKALAEYKKAQSERYADAHALLGKDLWNAYKDFVADRHEKRDAYVLALANFFAENGLEPAMASIDEFVAAVGKKKNSARQKVKTGKHNGEFNFNTWRDTFLGEICDVMGDALPLYKFTYVLKENRKKDA